MSRRILLILGSILLNITVSSQPMTTAMASMPMMNMASQQALKTMTETSIHSWHITVPRGQVYIFTDQQMSQIISTMPSDYRAQLSNDLGILCSYIGNNNITPEKLNPAQAQSTSRNYSLAYGRSSSVHARMHEIKEMIRENRTVPGVCIHVNKTFEKYNNLRIQGEKNQLESILKALKEKKSTWSEWLFGKKERKKNIRYIEALLKQGHFIRP